MLFRRKIADLAVLSSTSTKGVSVVVPKQSVWVSMSSRFVFPVSCMADVSVLERLLLCL